MRRSTYRPTNAARCGSALVLALISVTVVAGLGAAFLLTSSSLTRRQTGDLETQKAFYLAEAGLAEAFQAVRMGRTGQVGSVVSPAVHGDGLLWVDAVETLDEQIRLESTALCGTGRATLALVVEPVDVPLGFFSDEDLLVDDVLLVDGFNSEEATYADAAGGRNQLQEYAADMDGRAAPGDFAKLLAENSRDVPAWFVESARLSPRERTALTGLLPALRRAREAGTLFDGATRRGRAGEVHTDSGGLLGSNGSVTISTPSGEPVTVYGDVTPGAGDAVHASRGARISGSTDPRSTPIELPEVEVPPVALSAPVRHEGLLPMLVAPGTWGFERIEVAPDAELVLRGPATIVVGTLVLEPGAALTLDTRQGSVELYVTGTGMDLRRGSVVTTTSDLPDELTVQVSSIPTGPDGAPVRLDAMSRFHGTIYAPDTEVYVGSEFEVFGSIVARRLEFGPGARLHFDNAGHEGTPIPRVVSWRIVEIPEIARTRRGDPFQVLGLARGDLAALSQAHDLAAVILTIDYLDHGGNPRSYSGPEDRFDWDDVRQVVNVERDASREREDGASDPPPEDPPEGTIRAIVEDAIATLDSSALKGFLEDVSPLSEAELRAALDSGNLAPSDAKSVLLVNSPLAESLLLGLLSGTWSLSSSGVRDVLIASSPLSASVLDAVDLSSVLSLSDKFAILLGG